MASILNATTSSGLVTSADNSGSLQLATNNGTTAVTIDTNQRAAFVAGTAALPAITTTGDTNTGIFFPTADTIAFAEGGAESMRIDSSGNVGIGTSSPATKLHVAGTIRATSGGATTSAVTVTQGYINGDISSSNFSIGNYGDSSSEMRIDTRGFTTFYTGATNNATGAERMRITSGGALCVGTTSATGAVRFIVESDTTTLNPMTVSNTRSTASTDYSILFYRNGSIVGSVQTSLSATSFVTSSDYRLKENIAPMTGALAKVAQLNPVTYTWKSTGETSQGFIAHELQAVVPDCVTGEKDAVDADGNIKPQGVDTSFLVATLTAAIQELKAELDATKAEVQALKGVA